MAIMAVVYLVPSLLSTRIAQQGSRLYFAYVRWSAKWIVGISSQVRGNPPKGEYIIAAKHQSFFDIIILYSHLENAQFIMKRELLWTPIFGQYAMRVGCIPVRRGRGARALTQMVEDVTKGRKKGSPLCIYPQGTRVKPGVKHPYKRGVALLYRHFSQPCVPVAVNVGVFWPRRGILRNPGTAVVEFLPAIPPGLEIDPFMQRLEREIEEHSDRLMIEAVKPR